MLNFPHFHENFNKVLFELIDIDCSGPVLPSRLCYHQI